MIQKHDSLITNVINKDDLDCNITFVDDFNDDFNKHKIEFHSEIELSIDTMKPQMIEFINLLCNRMKWFDIYSNKLSNYFELEYLNHNTDKINRKYQLNIYWL